MLYIQSGKVKLTVVSARGREAVTRVLEPGSLLGEACLAGQRLRMSTAIAMQASGIIRVDKRVMIDLLHREPECGALFTAYLLSRTFASNRFRKMGFIHYNGGLQVHSGLLTVVLRD